MNLLGKEAVLLGLVGLLVPGGCSLAVSSELDGKAGATATNTDASSPNDAGDASQDDVGTPDTADDRANDADPDTQQDAPFDACSACDAAACCNGVCVELDVDPKHCGACNHPCAAGRSCVQGVCSGGWVAMNDTASLRPRLRACAAWTGDAMFVWGGVDENGEAQDSGELYDPIADTWTRASDNGMPTPREMPTCVAMGSRVFVWGGRDPLLDVLLSDGAVYDAPSDSWEALPIDNAPDGRLWPSAVWTGTQVIVWGGELGDAHQTKTGAMYDPALGAWEAMGVTGAPPRNKRMTTAWSGGTMLVFGGRDDGGGNVEQSIFGFAPGPNIWAKEATPLAPLGRSNAFGAWTGSAFLVWGGLNAVQWALGDGGLYNPNTKIWTYVVAETASSARGEIPYETGWSAWTGSSLVIMGGTDGVSTTYDDGVVFDPEAPIGSRWTDIPAWNPSGLHQYGVGVWTGEEFIVWGGTDGSSPMVDGSRWMP